MIGLLDIGIGNINSISNMLDFLGVEYIKIKNLDFEPKSINKLIINGNGNFKSVISKIKNQNIQSKIIKLSMLNDFKILGICVGAQIFGRYSEEGDCSGLGIVPFDVLKIMSTDIIKVPNVGWHYLNPNKNFKISYENSKFYFSHSYKMEIKNPSIDNIYINYGDTKICAAFKYKNILGVQFHPEKSHKYGLRLFEKFSKNDI